MTCKDCISYGKEVNIDDKTYHLCTDSGDLMTAEEEDDMFAMCGRFKPKMTCKDCKYYNGTVQATHTDYHICMKPKYEGFDSWCWVSGKLEKCKDYEPKENKNDL